MFTARNSLADNPSENDGIVKLWASPNLLDSEWKLNGNFGEDLFYFFIIPHGFYCDGNSFKFNYGFKIVNRPIDVYHDGIQKSEPLYVFEASSHPTCSLNTHKGTKLPYLIVPDVGEPNYYPEKRYFIPLIEAS